jgi:AcrR family transcriptional regulator
VINSNVMCAKFADADYLAAAQAIVVEHGPAAATMASISERLRAPTGSFYHRFASRDVLLGKLWLKAIGRARAAVHEPGVGPRAENLCGAMASTAIGGTSAARSTLANR